MNLTPTYHEKMSQAEQAIREAQRHAETELAAKLRTLLDQAHAEIAGDLTALLDSNDPARSSAATCCSPAWSGAWSMRSVRICQVGA